VGGPLDLHGWLELASPRLLHLWLLGTLLQLYALRGHHGCCVGAKEC
jgi:hypothetical protein